jgi:hypothetical protein
LGTEPRRRVPDPRHPSLWESSFSKITLKTEYSGDRQRQKDHEFKARLDHIMRFCLTKAKAGHSSEAEYWPSMHKALRSSPSTER